MSIIVPTLSQALQNIERFSSELDKSQELQRRLPFARAWYAHKTEGGSWIFAPSKFAGYKDMTAEEYLNDDPRDGRRTENQLQTWFTQLAETDPLYEELSEKLAAFLHTYGKAPSSAFRINVAKDYLENRTDEGAADKVLAELLIAVGRRLSPAERARVRAAL